MFSCNVLIALLLVGIVDASQNLGQDNLIRINLSKQSAASRDQFIFNQQFATTDNDDKSHLIRVDTDRAGRTDFIADIELGPQTFRVLLDSTSGDLWLPITGCIGIKRRITTTYDQTKSPSYQGDGRYVQLVYDHCLTISGHLGRETIEFANLKLKNQTFIQAHKVYHGKLLRSSNIDGILGLNFVSRSGYDDVEAPLHHLLRVANQQSNGKAKKILSFVLNHGPDQNRPNEMIIGGVDKSLYVGEITWVPLMRPELWQFRVDSMGFEDVEICQHGCTAVADIGTRLIVGNSKAINELNERIGARHLERGLFTLESCDNVDSELPVFGVTIGGREFTLMPSQYTFEQESVCFSAFSLLKEDLPHLTVGTQLLGQYYSIIDFENNRLGLAESVLANKHQ